MALIKVNNDQILAKLVKEGGEELKVIYELILKVWEEEIVPQKQKYGIVCPIHKKRDVLVWDSYRAVALLCAAYKILPKILYVKLLPYAAEVIRKYQGGFRQGRSTADPISTMRQILEKC
jgi:hypothetical protein